MGIGENIKKFRKEKKLTQKQLGELINKGERTIQKYEKGDILPPIDVISEVAKVLRVTVSDLIDAEIDTSIGDRIRQFRKDNHIAQGELANKLGITISYMNMLELNKKTNPSYLIKAKLNEILGAEIYDIGPSIQLLQLSNIPTRDLIEELNKRKDFELKLIYKESEDKNNE